MGSSLTTDVAFQPPARKDCKDFFTAHARTLEARDGVVFSRCGPSDTSVPYLFFAAPQARGTVLLCHGNAEDLATSYLGFRLLASHFATVPANFVAFDYSGYGCSAGEKPSEEQCYADVEAVLTMLQTERQIPRSTVVVAGRSLGSGPATEMASRYTDLAGLILISPLASAVSVLGPKVRYVLSTADIFRNRKKIASVTHYPVLIVHGMKDEVVPFWHGEELYNLLIEGHKKAHASLLKKSKSAATGGSAVPSNLEAIVEPDNDKESVLEGFVQRLWLPTCNHNDIEAIAGARFFNAVTKFVSFALPTSSSGQQHGS